MKVVVGMLRHLGVARRLGSDARFDHLRVTVLD